MTLLGIAAARLPSVLSQGEGKVGYFSQNKQTGLLKDLLNLVK